MHYDNIKYHVEQNRAGLSRANKVLSGSQFQKLDMKKMFNAFGTLIVMYNLSLK